MVANCGLHSENGFNYDQNYPKRPNQSQEYVFSSSSLSKLLYTCVIYCLHWKWWRRRMHFDKIIILPSAIFTLQVILLISD